MVVQLHSRELFCTLLPFASIITLDVCRFVCWVYSTSQHHDQHHDHHCHHHRRRQHHRHHQDLVLSLQSHTKHAICDTTARLPTRKKLLYLMVVVCICAFVHSFCFVSCVTCVCVCVCCGPFTAKNVDEQRHDGEA